MQSRYIVLANYNICFFDFSSLKVTLYKSRKVGCLLVAHFTEIKFDTNIFENENINMQLRTFCTWFYKIIVGYIELKKNRCGNS